MDRLEREVEKDPDAMEEEDEAALQEDIEEDPGIRQTVNIYRSEEDYFGSLWAYCSSFLCQFRTFETLHLQTDSSPTFHLLGNGDVSTIIDVEFFTGQKFPHC